MELIDFIQFIEWLFTSAALLLEWLFSSVALILEWCGRNIGGAISFMAKGFLVLFFGVLYGGAAFAAGAMFGVKTVTEKVNETVNDFFSGIKGVVNEFKR